MNYIDVVQDYNATLEQEKIDQELMLDFFKRNPDALDRSNLTAHVTSSVFIMNMAKTKVLMGFHNIYQSWGWFGGHNDGEADCLHVALKEATEETGIESFKKISESPVALDVIHVQNHIKKGRYVPDHLHLNVTYGLWVDDAVAINYNEAEHSGIKWFDINDYLDHVKEDRMIPLYQKIEKRMMAL